MSDLDVSQAERTITTIGVAGAGTMGSGIALVALQAGFTVILFDIAADVLARGRQYIQQQLTRTGNDAAPQHLICSTQIGDLAGSEVVIEAVVENLAVKQELFEQLDTICPPPAILATNTSTLSITAIAAAVTSPGRVGGMHFFNPAPVLPLVEIGRGAQTGAETVQTLAALAEQMGKTPVVTPDTPGFIVNRVARPFYGEALRLLGEGVATLEQIDQVVQLGGHFRMGPFRLMDLIGLDINLAATRSMYEQTYGEPRYQPHWIQEQMVRQHALGRKTGRGFYTYDSNTPPPEMPLPPPGERRSGPVWISSGSWAPGLAGLIQGAGYSLTDSAASKPTAGVVMAGRSEDLKEHVQSFEQALPPEVPLFCQAADVTVSETATWLTRPERLVGFDGLFVTTGQAVTLVAGPILLDHIRHAAEQFFTGLGRRVVWIEDSPALILPRLICMLANEAAFAAGDGVADGETIDRAMTLGANYPKGPLAWAKELGYGRVVAVLDHLQAEYGEDRYRTAPLLRRLARLDQL
ncbi:MAG: 3-hydroxyacyl-CoA dehydrogenase [Chloroflexota bacterium]